MYIPLSLIILDVSSSYNIIKASIHAMFHIEKSGILPCFININVLNHFKTTVRNVDNL